MPPPRKVRKGSRFGRWTVIKSVKPKRYVSARSNSSRWLCQCECGERAVVFETNLLSGRSTSCGCRVIVEED